jgi:thiol-disulfide isomerase/thioredoxin
MRRPNRLLCGTLLGLAVLVGCAKKPKTDPSGQADATPTPPPSGTTPTGRSQPSTPSKVDGNTPLITGASKVDPVVTPPSAPKAVELTQCRFALVEAALTAAKGKVILVDCWAVWGPPCVATFPKLVEKHEKYKDKGLVCLSVSLDAGRNPPDKVLAFLKQRNATFQNFYMTDLRSDDPKMDARLGAIEFIPHAALFNKKGEKVWHGNPGGPNEAKLTAMIDSELAK